MTLFSQRKGLRPLEKAIQREVIDQDLRNSLWSALKLTIWDRWSPKDHYGYQEQDGKDVELLVKRIWMHYFKQPIDTIPRYDAEYGRGSYDVIRGHFFEGKWWQVYDLLEFIVKNVPSGWGEKLKEMANRFLEIENSAYRLVDSEVVEITDKTEIQAIESGLKDGIQAARDHLERALDLLSDRKSPDYRNSVKESISAVESLSKSVTGMPKATLADCIKILKDNGHMHSAFEQALLKLYGYTSDEGGIRHALSDEGDNLKYSDAKFMLVACSGFVSYVATKASELGFPLRK